MSATTATELEMFRGDTAQINAVVTVAGAAFDLGGATVKFTAKRRKSDTAALFEKTSDANGGVTITSAAQGMLSIEIAPGDTASLLDDASRLVWDIEVTRGGKVYTVAHGDLRVVLDVTRS